MNGQRAGSDLTKTEQTSLRELHESLLAAYTAQISSVTVWALPKGLRENSPGTGLLLKTRLGTPFLLTARHLFEKTGQDCPDLALWNESVCVRQAGTRVIFGPRRPGASDSDHAEVDVAAVALSHAGRDGVCNLAGASLASDSATQETDKIVISGFPSFLTDARPTVEGYDVAVARIIYITGISGTDEFGRLQVEWDDAQGIPPVAKIPGYPVNDGAVFQLGHPRGISGGGVWRVRGPTSGEIWAPSKHCELIGVAVAVLGKHELAEPVDLWHPWLLQAEDEIDRLA